MILNRRSACNQTWFDSTPVISRSVLWNNWIDLFKVRVRGEAQSVSDCSSGWYLLNRRTFGTELGMVMQHQEPECHAGKKNVYYLQGQGHNECSYDQNTTLSTISSELLILWQTNLVWRYIIISRRVLGGGGGERIVVFQVKVTAKL